MSITRRKLSHDDFANAHVLQPVGLTPEMLALGVTYVYDLLDNLDESLLSKGEERLSQIFELANFSSMVGNILRSGISKASHVAFKNNGPHRYPDLVNTHDATKNVEIKMALEDNQPKGHLAKEGWHLTCRYVLCDAAGAYTRGTENRGCQIAIWELRFGYLRVDHFNTSNTKGDSGKTAVVNAAGMLELVPVFVDLKRSPLSPKGSKYKYLARVFAKNHSQGLPLLSSAPTVAVPRSQSV